MISSGRETRQPLEVGDLHAAHNELRRHLGPGDRTSLGYIASILREAGYEVRYEDRYSDPGHAGALCAAG